MRQPDPPDSYLPLYGRSGRPLGEPVQPAPRPPRTTTSTRGTVMLWKLTLAQWTILGGGALAVLGTLLPWYSVSFVLVARQQSVSIVGWDVPTGKITLLLGLAGAILLLLQVFKIRIPARLDEREVLIYIGLGAESFILALMYLLDGPTVVTPSGTSTGLYSAGSGLGLYLTLIGSAAIAVGGYLRRYDRRSWLL